MAQKVKRTNAQLIELVQNLNRTPSERNTKREAKLKKIAEKIRKFFDEYNEEREEIRLEHAHTDKDGVLVMNGGEYKYTKDGLKAMQADMKNLLQKEFEFYQLTFTLEGIEDLQFLEGWVERMKSEPVDIENEEPVDTENEG